MKILRTPEERFRSLVDFPFEPQYVELSDGIRVHHVDEGDPSAAPVLLMHGEPTWSYLYRKMIPVIVAAGHRVVAPDLVGFGRSDKPSEQSDYTYERHVDWMAQALFDRLDLREITVFGQDWGGLIGLRLLALAPERVARVIVANTGLPTGEQPMGDAFLAWQRYARETPEFPVGQIVAGGCVSGLPKEAIMAYDAPFPDQRFTAGARRFPALVPTTPDDPAHDANVAAWATLLTFEKPFLCAFSDSDPITKGGERQFIGRVPGAAGQPHTTIAQAGHFLQEDRGEELAELIVRFIEST